MDGPGTERGWFSEQGLGQLPLHDIQDAYGSLLYAADAALQNPEELREFDGVGDATIEKLRDIAPLNPPGEWEGERRDDGGYRFWCGDVEIYIEREDEEYITRISSPRNAKLTDTYGIGIMSEPLISPYWGAKRVMERNPSGSDSKVPENVETPEEWELWQNLIHLEGQHGPVAWRHEGTKENIRIRFKDGHYELVHHYPTRDKIPESVIAAAPGSYEGLGDLLDRAEMQMKMRTKAQRKKATQTL